jgi:1-acyl-sn-glycerol-3-phosphate acyltransferase
MDPPLFAAYHLPSFVAKSGVAYLPVIGSVARALQCVWVNRFSSDSRRDASAQLLKRIEYSTTTTNDGDGKKDPNGDSYPHVMLFPEGACTNGSALITFKPGTYHITCHISSLTRQCPLNSLLRVSIYRCIPSRSTCSACYITLSLSIL